ncbi:MAG TPA: hypothetical protein VND95_14510 [Stellaceae bacterium]|nr:hypothetical protein [Stellaceae bacterium]
MALAIEPMADCAGYDQLRGPLPAEEVYRGGHEIIELMGRLKLAGMRATGACPRAARSADPGDEAITAGRRAQHSVQRIIGELLLAQLADNRARSTAYRLGVARFPVMKNLAEKTQVARIAPEAKKRRRRRSSGGRARSRGARAAADPEPA